MEQWISFKAATMRLAPVAGGNNYSRQTIYGLLMARMSPFVNTSAPDIVWDEVPRKFTSPPPSHPHLSGKEPASADWFNLAQQIECNFTDRPEWPQFMHDYNKWLLADDCLLVDWNYIARKEIAEFAYVPDVMLINSKDAPMWSFPESLAWVASRSHDCVARLYGHCEFEASRADDPDKDEARSLTLGWHATGRSKIVGWLAYDVAESCTTCLTDEGAPCWKTCTCLSRAYSELRDYSVAANFERLTIPELIVQKADGAFDLTWPAKAAKIRFSQSEVVAKWPAPAANRDIAHACEIGLKAKTVSLRDWTIANAVVWHFDRDEGRANDPAFQMPSLTAALMYSDDMGGGNSWIASATAIRDALKAGNLIANRVDASGLAQPIAAGFWNGVAPSKLDGVEHSNVFILSASVKSAFSAEVEASESPLMAHQPARAPSVKAGYPPHDDAIIAKAEEMKARGMRGQDLAKEMRLEAGFENVAVRDVRALIKGRWKGGRPSKKLAH